ncbi:nucleoside triphosphate pyrophosphohydrolase [bacterium]|jgi:predicted house-cleaning noncanonical NTP pyrophosphatase (MazG superfamily)|nr:nucleoside triphosphate pyrophosphohydrolase [bacterium]MBT3903357.1 nucleoside triphosphate pyrophosphohydrolase [bacterium]MBT5345454.1 nucleoside triphosphate pyrophosphohydrolase [bacterium]MBT6528502.1 nucleoside triphosphate pyrophosphohydrolase [bacterium]
MTRSYRFKIDKLIRDRIPKIMEQQGQSASVRTLEHGEYVERLQDKLLEEAREAVQAQTSDELREELADLLEVVRSLAAVSGITLDAIERARIAKREKKGGFDKRVYAAHADIGEDAPILAYYRANPSAYPEVDYDEK